MDLKFILESGRGEIRWVWHARSCGQGVVEWVWTCGLWEVLAEGITSWLCLWPNMSVGILVSFLV
jgi:hypothetical protein